MLGSGVVRFSSRQTMSENLLFSSIIGASYSTGIVRFSITQSGRTLQNMAIFSKMLWSSMGTSVRRTMIFGLMPMPCSSLTECWVGFDLCSPEPFKYGTRVTWIKREFSGPTSWLTCLMASKNGWLSISPAVPPISVITMSALFLLPTL